MKPRSHLSAHQPLALVVGGDHAARKSAHGLLTALGYEVFQFSQLEDAVTALSEVRFEAVVALAETARTALCKGLLSSRQPAPAIYEINAFA
jgi:FixJ family two-component response regulator